MRTRQRNVPALLAIAALIGTPVLALISTVLALTYGPLGQDEVGGALLLGGLTGAVWAGVLVVTLPVLRQPARPERADSRWWAGGVLAGATSAMGAMTVVSMLAEQVNVHGSWAMVPIQVLAFGWLATVVGVLVGLLLGLVLMMLVIVRPGSRAWAIGCSVLVGAVGTPLTLLMTLGGRGTGLAQIVVTLAAFGAVAGGVLGVGLSRPPRSGGSSLNEG